VRRGALLAVFASVLVGACSLFTGLDGFSDGPAPTPDGGGVASESGTGLGEGGGADSSSGFVPPPIDAATPFCPTRTGVKFCSDFDRLVNLEDEWTRQVREGNNNIRVGFETSRSVSASRSLRIFMPALGGGTFYGLLEKRFTDVLDRPPIRLNFDIYMPKPNFAGTGNVSLFSFGFYGPADNQAEISQEMFLNAGGDMALTTLLRRAEPNRYEFTPATAPLANDRWAHVRFETNMKTGAGSYVRIWFDEVLVLDKTGTAYMAGPHEYMYFALGFGRYDNGATPEFEAFYDNVVLETL